MLTFVKKPSLFFVCTVFLLSLQAQKNELTDDQYFKSNYKGIVQSLPIVTKWVDDNHFILLKNGSKYLVDAKTGSESEMFESATKQVEAGKAYVFTKAGDLFITKNGKEIQLTADKEKKSNPVLSPDGNYVAFTQKNNLYTINVNTQKVNMLTSDGSDVILNGYSSWLYMEEILGRASQYRAFWWSPDSRKIAYFRTDDSKVPVFTITDSKGLHGEVENTRYPKVGDPNPSVKIGIVSPDGGNVVWTKINDQDGQYFGLPYWKPDGSSLLVQWMPRKQDQLKIYAVNPATGELNDFYTEQQKTWISLDDEGKRISFLKNGKGLILMSDKSGWKNLYYYDMNGKLITPITSGRFTVTSLEFIDEKNSLVYFCARGRENTARTDYYCVSLNGNNLKRLTFGEYNHSIIDPSPTGAYFVTTYSNAFTPAKMTLVNNKGKIIKELGDSKAPEFDEYKIAKTELIRVKSDDGLFELPMKVTWPLNMDSSKKYPVLISIYGGPDAGNCWDSWTFSGQQQWYAKEGLIQVVMDHRASGQFGKEGVNYMYHDLGHWELVDYSTMVKWLIANRHADPAKICITGFSYGGYMATLAVTKGADVFTYGMAGGPVTDWTLYDSHYTERYMGLPKDNPEGYKTGNVMNYVDKYKGMLQIVHGEIDNNVHMQNSLQLISKLEDAKKDFEMMVYPGGRHGWGGNKGLHFQNLKNQFIYKYLLEKPVNKMVMK
ncbi:MAG: peptidase dipeptidylpeptidase domain protein [Ferruginibacter sp.]|nr:peptidase dipeptidylpeptidase domain protein [Ferruginibacter sp.]